MFRFKTLILSCFFLICSASVSHSKSSEALSKQFSYWSLSTKNLALKKGLRITGLLLKLKGAYIYAAPLVPQDWEFDISNWGFKYRPWTSFVKASAHHGAGWVDPDFFKNFVIIGKDIPTEGQKLNDKFDIVLEISTLDTSNDKKGRITFHEKDLLFVPVKVQKAF